MEDKRSRMVYSIKSVYGISSPDILSAMLQVPRHKFIEKKYRKYAYDDKPLELAEGSTISQPFTVAFMTDLLDLTGKENVLEIGTGSGYQAAILSKLAKKVYSVEINHELLLRARKTIKELGYRNIYFKEGSGEFGWSEHSPFDAIIVTAGLDEKIPDELINQLSLDGVLVAPVGKNEEKIMKKIIKRKSNGKVSLSVEEHGIFKFVPFIYKKAS